MTSRSVAEVIQAAIDQEDAKPNPERRSVPWDDDKERLIVVTLPLNQLRFNPNSHRIKAQLAAHPNRTVVASDPFGDESQRIIAKLLQATEGFEDLKADLAERGQIEPGVVTREGVLVNANTRAAALRALEKTHIRVIVLPPNATVEQISELELRLQVSKDYKQDYTYTNQLLFIRDCQTAHWSEERIAREVYGTEGTKSKRIDKVKRDLRVLAMIDELIQTSGDRFGYPDFDDKSVALEELDRDYQQLKKSDAEAALRLRAARLVALLSGVGYRDIRFIDERFSEHYLAEELDEDEELALLTQQMDENSSTDPEGLDLLGESTSDDESAVTNGLLKWLTETAGDDEVSLGNVDGTPVTRSRADVVDALQTAVESAVSDVKATRQRGNLLKQPAKAVREATTKLKAAAAAFDKARTDEKFVSEVDNVRDKAAAARRALDSLEALIDEWHPRTEDDDQ